MYIGCCVNMLPKEQGDPGLSYAPSIKQAGIVNSCSTVGEMAEKLNEIAETK